MAPGLFVPPRRNHEFPGRYELDQVYMKVTSEVEMK
jgi:hypothetical protein